MVEIETKAAPTNDRVVGAFGELIGLMFGLPAGEALYRGEDFSMRMAVFLLLGLGFCILGPSWPWLKLKLGRRYSASVIRVATDFRWWLLLLMVIFFYLGTPMLVERIRTTSMPVPKPEAVSAPSIAPSPVPTPYQYRNEMTINEVMEMVRQLNGLFKQDAPLTFVITAPPESSSFSSDFYALVVAACQLAGNSSCTIEPAPDPRIEIDTGIPSPEYPGIVIHHEPTSPSDVISTNYMWALGRFVARKSSHIPDGIARLNINHNPHFYWFELGPGCPWKDTRVCGG